MVDYSKLSDFEINCEVAKANEWTSKSFAHEIHSGKWNPCQNPADAWPIITENNISIILDNPTMPCATSNVRDLFEISASLSYVAYDNPLRAAMIVFLMMQEEK